MAGNISNVLRQRDDGVLMNVKVVPNSKRNSVSFDGGILKVKLSSPPVDGKANETLKRFMADALNLRKSCIEIVKGEISRNKVLLVKGVDEEYVESKLNESIGREL